MNSELHRPVGSTAAGIDVSIPMPASLLANLIEMADDRYKEAASPKVDGDAVDPRELVRMKLACGQPLALYRQHLPETVCREVSDRLYADMRSRPSDFEGFRYEAFARRIVAAEHGRPDAVEWAMRWYGDLLVSDLARTVAEHEQIAAREEVRANGRRELKAGRAGNPLFQAYLDTLESPEEVLFRVDGDFQGWTFMLWLSPLRASFEADGGNDQSWVAFVRKHADEHLCDRVKHQRALLSA